MIPALIRGIFFVIGASGFIAARAHGAPVATILERARGSLQEADFDAAAKAYQAAIDAGGLSPSELAEAFLGIGIGAFYQGNSKRALDAFRLAVVVDGNVSMTDDAPKKAKTLLDQARREMKKRTLDWFRVTIPEGSLAAGAKAATVRVRTDAVAGLEAVEVEARSGDGEPWIKRFPISRDVDVLLPSSVHTTGRVRLRISAIDDVGNRWAEYARSLDVDRTPKTEPVIVKREEVVAARPPVVAANSAAPPTTPPLWSSPWPWIGLGLVGIGVGAAFSYSALDSSSPARIGVPRVQ